MQKHTLSNMFLEEMKQKEKGSSVKLNTEYTGDPEMATTLTTTLTIKQVLTSQHEIERSTSSLPKCLLHYEIHGKHNHDVKII